MNLEERIKELEEENKGLKETVLALTKRIEELEELVKEKSRPVFIKEEIIHRHAKTGQKEGHLGISRTIPDKIDEVKELKEDSCRFCGSHVGDTIEVRRRYVVDIPEVKAVTTEYVIHRRYCKHCKKVVEPSVPALPRARFGLRLMLLVLLLKLDKRMPSKQITSFLEVQYGLKLSDGEVYGMLRQLAEAFGSYYEEIKEKIKSALVKHSDETGWRENGKNRWLWLFINKEVALYLIREKRSSKVPAAELGDQQGNTVISDRLNAYTQLAKVSGCTQQICWAHILRESGRLAELYPEARYVHKRLKTIYATACSYNHSATAAQKEQLLHWIDVIATSRTYQNTSVYKFVKSICRKHHDNLFRFVDNPEIESTNNCAEQGLRHAVVMRKISNGSRSAQGAETTAQLLSITRTIKMNAQNPMDFMMNWLQKGK